MKQYDLNKLKRYIQPTYIPLGFYAAIVAFFHVFALPVILFGNPSIFIKFLILPLICFDAWNIKMFVETEKSYQYNDLNMALLTSFLSIICLTGAYRFYTVYFSDDQYKALLIAVSSYLLIIACHFLQWQNRLCKEEKSPKRKRISGSMSTSVVLGGIVGMIVLLRMVVQYISNDQALVTLFIAGLLLVLAYLSAIGFSMFHKYYLQRRYAQYVVWPRIIENNQEDFANNGYMAFAIVCMLFLLYVEFWFYLEGEGNIWGVQFYP